MFRVGGGANVANKKWRNFRTHDLTKELAYVSTQIQAKVYTCI